MTQMKDERWKMKDEQGWVLWCPDDDVLLDYLQDDGVNIEPKYYVPIIPMVLVNGSKGIGTGFSTDIMCYNPLEIIDYLKNKLMYIEDKIDFIPYYEGFKGTILPMNEKKNKYLIKTSPTYIARNYQNIQFEHQVIELFKLIEFNNNITNPNIVLKINSMKPTVIEVLNNTIYPSFSSHMEVMSASSTPR